MFRRLTKMSLALGKLLLLVLIVALPVLSPSVASAAETPKKVLIFSGVDPNLPNVSLMSQILRSTLEKGLPGRVQFYSEALDTYRIPEERYEQELVRLLQRKYQGEKFDLIFTLGSSALKFLLKHKDELFSDTPKVFIHTNDHEGDGLDLGPNVTGVQGKIELAPGLELALSLHPGTRRVVVVTGNSSMERFWEALAHQEFRSYEDRVEFTYLTNTTMEELRNNLASLPPHTIVFFIGFMLDRAGNAYSLPESVSLAAPSSAAPVYVPIQSGFRQGVVGGRMISYDALGKAGAELGLRVLAGERPQNIPPQTVPSAAIFDWREFRRWGIDESKLPAFSIVLNREFSVWELYKWRIIGVISLCVLQAVLIVGLLINRAKRKQALKDNERLARLAKAEHQRLDEVVSNVPGLVWEVAIDPASGKRKTTFVSGFVEQMLGYRPEDFVSTTGFGLSLVPDEDRERVERETNEIFAAGSSGTIQYRWLTSSGRAIWVEAQLAVMRDEDDRPVGLRGVTMDITDRRLAEESLRASEERLQQAISVARFGVFEHDHLTGILNASPMTREIHTWGEQDTPSLEELIVQLHPEDRETFIAAVGSAHDPAGDGFFACDYRIVLPGGKVRWVSARARTLFEGENGERYPLRTIGAELDITERKEAEEALQRAHEEVSRLKNQLQEENIYLQEEIKLSHNVDEIIGRSNGIKYVLFKIEQVSQTDSTVMILGETGTGKELVARAIHSQSLRKERPLVKVNCAALSANLIESELFGHEKGSFTGAFARKIGRFELADGATLFLDEIGELPLDLQSKLLRVLQEGEFERLGSSKTTKVDVRIIAATNRNMKTEVEKGAFREDLWYRLNVFPITVPPLGQRKEDIPPMVEHFVNSFSRKVGKNITAVSSATLKKLQDYSWPGNVRELANVIERGVITAQGPVLHIADRFEQAPAPQVNGASKTLDELEKEYITRILDDTSWRIEGPNGAARILGLNPSTLRTRMVKLGIQKSARSSASA